MLEKIIRFSINQKWFILIASLIIAILGVYNFQRLPIDAVPDITNVQVQVNTEAPGLSPFEIEQRITFPIETLMAGLPKLEKTRSLSRYGLSQVSVIFQDGTNIYFARQLVNERIQEAKGHLPPEVEPTIGPTATGLGDIFMYAVEAQSGAKKTDGKPYTSTDLRTIQDWIIKPQLRNTPGVTEVNSIGGYQREIHVTPYPERLMAYGLTFQDVIEALEKNNENVAAGYIERAGEQYLIRAPGQVSNLEEIRQIIVSYKEEVPIFVKDIAEVVEGKELRAGAATLNGEETVLGIVLMLIGENSRTVSRQVADKMEKINQTLPEGVVAKTVYNRTLLVDDTIVTVTENLALGALLVILILFLFLGNMRAALITAMVIPLSMLFTITGMVKQGISANLMSLGALDFGLIVDGAVIIVENCIRRLCEERRKLGRALTGEERQGIIQSATSEVRRVTMFGEIIIMIVYLPILTLTGIEGKMFTPMALTVIMALIAAMILSVTFVPAAVAAFLTKDVSEKEIPIMRFFKKSYIPTINWAMRHKKPVILTAIILVLITAGSGLRMGRAFIPTLDEGDIVLQPVRLPGISVSQSVLMQKIVEKKIMEFPEVKTVFSKIGTGDIASDPMGPNVGDTFIMLKKKSEWPNRRQSKEALIARIEKEVKKIPGNAYEFTQPIQMRFNELIAGVKSDLAVKVFGDDTNVLLEKAQDIANLLTQIKGASDVKVEQMGGLPMLTIDINRRNISRYGLNMSDVQSAIEIALGGKTAGEFFEGDRRFPVVVRLPEDLRNDLEALKAIPIPLPQKEGSGNNYLPLGSVANFKIAQGPNQITRENGKRKVAVTANIRGRDIGSFLDEAQQAVRNQVKIPSGYWIEWGGQFEQMISATKRLSIVVPIALLLIFMFLLITFGSMKDALIVFTGVPLALTGGITALWIRGIPLSISAGVGFIALSGVAVLNGLVMISFIKRLHDDGKDLDKAIFEGAITRLRPVLMTALVASLGFIPMALATGRGAEVQRPLATVVIGGILSSTILTLIVLPVLYRIFHKKDETVPVAQDI